MEVMQSDCAASQFQASEQARMMSSQVSNTRLLSVLLHR